ncbi:ABC transporter substrate-binding protein [Trueperella pyogenes]|uniref:ABC transporter substrate-binding protein n=1 Tax=Trueperella pyogenes TaxID=1661 RepID=UPI002168C06A|nr:ABC transporter substrate-binding protein [Trueperella pyogenes]UVJ57250.1 ABC transporter substrate-binding protein [Trueperella pyogenes]
MKRTLSVLAAATLALSLTACSGDDAAQTSTTGTEGFRAADLSAIEKNDELAAMVPAQIAADGKLVLGTNIFFAPAEFYAPDGVTPQGYDIDLGKALGKILGLETEFQHAEFAAIIPGIGSRYEAGIANFTINPERQEVVDMIQYLEAGSAWAVPAGNPKGFDQTAPCGTVVGVQTGTYQEEVLTDMNAKACKDNPIQIQSLSEQSAVTLRVASGQIDAMYTDSPVADYAISQNAGKIERIGEVEDSAGYGVVAAKDNPELTKVLQAALQKLMDDGHLKAIFTTWGITEGVATQASLNPVS